MVTPVAVAPVEAPEPKAVDTINKFSVGVVATANFNTVYPSPFYPTFEARFGYDFTSNFSAGLSVGYDMDGYVPLKAYAKYNLPVVDGLYVKADTGVRFGLTGRNTQFLLGAGIGYEYGITENVSVFGEAGIDLLFAGNVQVVPGITLGAKVTF